MADQKTVETTKSIIIEVLLNMDIAASVEYEESMTQGHVFNIITPEPYMLIGKQGAHLHALQILIQTIVFKRLKPRDPFYFTIDVDDYKRKREWYLKETVKAAIEKLKRVDKNINLEPMPNYERKFIHAFIQDSFPDVYSESLGAEPYRKIVIKLKKYNSQNPT